MNWLQSNQSVVSREVDPLQDTKILQFIQPFLAETSWRAPNYNVQVLKILVNRVASPFKQVREELANLLALVTRNLWHNPIIGITAAFSSSEESSSTFFESSFASIQGTVFNMKTTSEGSIDSEPPLMADSMEEEGKPRTGQSESAEDTSHARETLLLTVLHALRNAAVSPVALHTKRFLRVLFASLTDDDRDTANLAKQAAALVAQVILFHHKPRVAFVEHLLALPRPNTFWHIKAAMLPFLQIFLFNHRFLMSNDDINRVRGLVISLLTDSRVEVRELASGSLASILHVEEVAQIMPLADMFLATLGKPVTRRTLKSAPEERIRHGAALGLSAIVQSATLTVPTWLPPLLVQLAPFEDDAQPSISETVKKAFAEFIRTHQEAWEVHQEAFTEEQLAIIAARGKTTTSYYL